MVNSTQVIISLIRSSSLLLVSVGMSTGCAITGDPHSGGIFWSAKKNQERIVQLEQHVSEAQKDLATEQRVQEQYTQERDQAAYRVSSLEAQITAHRQRQSVLKAQLKEAIQKKQLKEGELKKLLGDYYQLIDQANQVDQRNNQGLYPHNGLSAIDLSARLQAENQDYLKAILILTDY